MEISFATCVELLGLQLIMVLMIKKETCRVFLNLVKQDTILMMMIAVMTVVKDVAVIVTAIAIVNALMTAAVEQYARDF